MDSIENKIRGKSKYNFRSITQRIKFRVGKRRKKKINKKSAMIKQTIERFFFSTLDRNILKREVSYVWV